MQFLVALATGRPVVAYLEAAYPDRLGAAYLVGAYLAAFVEQDPYLAQLAG